jgi:hypothetical protein
MNFAANLHPALEHVGATGFSSTVGPLHKFTVSHAIIFACCMMDSGVFISPASGAHSNKQYAKFFMPTSMLNTLVVDSFSSFADDDDADATDTSTVSTAATGCGMQYIPSHEAIAGDGIDLFCRIMCIHACDHAFRCFCTAKIKYMCLML